MTSLDSSAGQPGLGAVPGVRSGLAAAGLFALVPVAQATHVGVDDALVVAAVLTGGLAALLPLRHAVLVAVTAWALLTGFVVNTAAQLSFGTHDLGHLVVLAGVAVAVVEGQRGTRTRTRPRTHVSRSSLPGPIESPSS